MLAVAVELWQSEFPEQASGELPPNFRLGVAEQPKLAARLLIQRLKVPHHLDAVPGRVG